MTDDLDTTTRESLTEIIRQNMSSMQAIATKVQPRLQQLPGIRAVVFDVYGTLLISGSGDVGTSNDEARPTAFGEALKAAGIEFSESGQSGVEQLAATIGAHHSRARQQGIDHPEVDIRDVWSDLLQQLANDGQIDPTAVPVDTARLALEYEMRTNPVAPMPGCLQAIHQLRSAGMALGIVSNAQVFTKLLFPALLDCSLDQLGFAPELCIWSYEHGRAKPGTYLYEQLAGRLEQRQITTQHVLFVGNDRLKDAWPADRVGFRTALFAGDSRSYRPRDNDERLDGLHPDLLLTELAQLPECVITND